MERWGGPYFAWKVIRLCRRRGSEGYLGLSTLKVIDSKLSIFSRGLDKITGFYHNPYL